MSMPSIASNFFSQPLPVGQMIETAYPASRSVVASCHTRRSNGLGRFSTRNRTRLAWLKIFSLLEVAQLDVDRHEARGLGRVAADPHGRGLAPAHRRPVDAVPAV